MSSKVNLSQILEIVANLKLNRDHELSRLADVARDLIHSRANQYEIERFSILFLSNLEWYFYNTATYSQLLILNNIRNEVTQMIRESYSFHSELDRSNAYYRLYYEYANQVRNRMISLKRIGQLPYNFEEEFFDFFNNDVFNSDEIVFRIQFLRSMNAHLSTFDQPQEIESNNPTGVFTQLVASISTFFSATSVNFFNYFITRHNDARIWVDNQVDITGDGSVHLNGYQSENI